MSDEKSDLPEAPLQTLRTPTQPAAEQVTGRNWWEFLGHSLVSGLVLAAIGVPAFFYVRHLNERTEQKKARLQLAREIEPLATNFVLAVRNSANLSVTYGDGGDVQEALNALKRLRNDNASLYVTRGVELANLFGGAAVVAYEGLHGSIIQLEECFQRTLARMTDHPNEEADSSGRWALREECSNALKVLNKHRDNLLEAIAGKLAADGNTAIANALKSQPLDWIPVSIRANGADGAVTLKNDEVFGYTWSAPDATACQLTAPTGPSGISRIGKGGPVGPDHPWYPRVGGATTLLLNCTNGWATGTNSVTLRR